MPYSLFGIAGDQEVDHTFVKNNICYRSSWFTKNVRSYYKTLR